ncbi:hypothetical protein ScPMuIL_003430 [Solemya velum]
MRETDWPWNVSQNNINCYFFLLIFLFLAASTSELQQKAEPYLAHLKNYNKTLTWAVLLKGDHQATNGNSYAETFADENNLLYLGTVGDLRDYHLFGYKPISGLGLTHDKRKLNIEKLHYIHKRSITNEDVPVVSKRIEAVLENHEKVEWYSQQRILSRHKRSLQISDPYYRKQWHLKNHINFNMDINVTGVWERNITGTNITVSVVDDGLEWRNPDLRDNYSPEGSYDLNADDPDPSPDTAKLTNHHGTRCAGEISAVVNNICGVGVAFGSRISGLRVLDGLMTDSLEANAFSKNNQINAIYSCSWGPDDDGKTVDGPHALALTALKNSINFGRDGYGNIFVVASGNGGQANDNCNYDGYANSIYTVTIGAVDETGNMPYYSEECAAMLAVTFSSGDAYKREIVTTDWQARGATGCTENHSGTSAAAPLAAGMIALMLQARPCLTWRDVQYIIAMSAEKVDIDVAHWQKNGAGLYHSHKHGFGLMRAWKLVNAAKTWKIVPWMTSYIYNKVDIHVQIPKGHRTPLKMGYNVTEEKLRGYELNILEYVQVTVTLEHPHRGMLEIRLQCPSGTDSVIGATRSHDNSSDGLENWTFSTVRCWGESPVGRWILTITDIDNNHKYANGFLKRWQIHLYGSPMTTDDFQSRMHVIRNSWSGEHLTDSYSLPCPPPPVTAAPDKPVAQKTLKILVLTGVFCIIMGIYESLEYCLCYEEEKKEQRHLLRLHKQAQRLSSQNSGDATPDADESARLLSGESQNYEEIPMEIFEASLRSESANRNDGNILYNNTEDEHLFTENHVLPNTPCSSTVQIDRPDIVTENCVEDEIDLTESDSLLGR